MNRYGAVAFSIVSCFILSSVSSVAATPVVVVPLGGAKGNAVKGDVLRGKTFSSSIGKGITGIRPPAPVAASGQTVEYLSGDNGTYPTGETDASRWGSGAIIVMPGSGQADYLTGLNWERTPNTTQRDWSAAVGYCEDLVTGFFTTYTDWRLPTVKEMQSLIDFSQVTPALPAGHPFTVKSSIYWTATTLGSSATQAFYVDLSGGSTTWAAKVGNSFYTWCVRGPFY